MNNEEKEERHDSCDGCGWALISFCDCLKSCIDYNQWKPLKPKEC